MSHCHAHASHEEPHAPKEAGNILTIRSHSGLSGDMLVAGLLCMHGFSADEINARLAKIMPELAGTVALVKKTVSHVSGWHLQVSLPHEHEHRHCADIVAIIAKSGLCEQARDWATATFELLATLSLSRLVVSPLPVGDGSVQCAHGLLPVPAPAVLRLLEGLKVCPFAGQGETVTPTAAALLHVWPVEFGPWPTMQVAKTALVYGSREFADLPNGVSFAMGKALV